MPIPRNIRRGQAFSITMMELRKQPGEVIEAVRDGAIVYITKQGRHIATMAPPDDVDDTIVVNPDGSTVGNRRPLTWRRPDLLRN